MIINNLLEEELYFSFCSYNPDDYSDNHYYRSGFIKNKNDKDLLYCSKTNGLIEIWDLYNKQLVFRISIMKNKRNIWLKNIIEWNKKYAIVADLGENSFYIIDLENNKIISKIRGHNVNTLTFIKKVNHPIYGESLMSLEHNGSVKLWVI